MRLLVTGEGCITVVPAQGDHRTTLGVSQRSIPRSLTLGQPPFPWRETLAKSSFPRRACPREDGGGNPGLGFLSYEIDAHPPHLFPGHEFAAHDLYVAPGPFTKYGSEAV